MPIPVTTPDMSSLPEPLMTSASCSIPFMCLQYAYVILFSFYPVHSAGSKLVLSCCRRCFMCGCLGCPAFAVSVSTSNFCVMRLPPFVCDVLVYRLAMGCFVVPAFSNGYRLDV
ncbi:hypothetical protein BDV36DRAFT_124820 [Aspergillus pseudocaelatus]|uniref:4Fe-4S ferredoxin-type domain-containing protein n=1 Tax=Aspergillus pseudocaelatus TaxID=1825620 RepID=A0ABQ6WS35_9EURO|nr:hypothetical protein BDV36DRAFT_124820 [Aspergillus pseudocaelatus]